MIFSESVGSGALLSAELTGHYRTMNSQVPQIQRFVGLFYPLMSALDTILKKGQVILTGVRIPGLLDRIVSTKY